MERPEPPETFTDLSEVLAELILQGAAEVYLRPLPRDLIAVWVPGGAAALCDRGTWRETIAAMAARRGAA